MNDLEQADFVLELMAEQQPAGKRWVHLLPAGKFTGRDGRGPYNLGRPMAVIQHSREIAGKTQIAVDYDHQSVFGAVKGVGGTAPAAGWITGMQAKDDGIWGHVEWTSKAAAHIENREYRYLSPVFLHDKKTGDVFAIKGAALTNFPNLDLAEVAHTEQRKAMDHLAELRKLVGLDETADFGAVAAKVKQLGEAAHSAAPDPSKFVPIGDFQRAVSEANKLRQGISKQDAEAHVGAQIAAGKVPPFSKDWAVSLCMANKPAFDEFVAGVGPGFVNLVSTVAKSNGWRRGSDPANGNLTENELAVCSQMGITAEQFTKARGRVQTNLE